MKKILVLITTLALLLVGCGNSDYNDNMNKGFDDAYDVDDGAFEESTEYGNQMAPEVDMAFNESISDVTLTSAQVNSDNLLVAEKRKIIKSGYITMETLKYDETIVKLQEKVSSYGGYIEVSNIGGASLYNKNQVRNAYFTLRIPQTSFQNFMEEVNTIGHVISQRSDGQDITSTYYDTDARVNTMEVQEERLLEILKKADKIEDVIILEQELSSVRYEIERLTQSLRRWDELVSYSTLEVNINEVYEITEKEVVAVSFKEKISNGFDNTIKDIKEGLETLIINLSSASPYLVFIIPGFFIVWIIFKKVKKGYHYEEISRETTVEEKKNVEDKKD